MCWTCSTRIIEGLDVHEMDDKRWKDLMRYLEVDKAICRNEAIRRNKPLPRGKWIYCSWYLFLQREKFNFERCEVIVGVGVPNETGMPDKDRTCYYRKFLLESETPNMPDEARARSRFAGRFHATFFSEPDWNRHLVLHHGKGSSWLKANIGFTGIEEEVFPIMLLNTKFGLINLIPSTEKPSLQTLCSKLVAKRTRHFNSIDTFELNITCEREVKREWIRHHRLYVVSC